MPIRTKDNAKELIGKSINAYYPTIKPKVDEIKFKEQYQGRIIDCMVGEIDDDYITTPPIDLPSIALEGSKEGLVKVVNVKGKTILVDEDGNETNTPREGCRLISVGEDEDNKLVFVSKNKNLFDGEMMVGTISNVDGTTNSNIKNESCCKNFIQIDSSLKVTISRSNSYDTFALRFYDKHFNFISSNYNSWTIANGASSRTYTFPQEVSYIKFKSMNNDINIKYQIEYGDAVTNYVEPNQHKTEFLLQEPLRSLPNGVCDEIIGNQLIKRIASVKLRGNENWTIYSSAPISNENTLFSCDIGLTPKRSTRGMIVNSFAINNSWSDATKEGIQLGRPLYSGLDIRINKNKLETDDVKGFNQWLKENPTEVLYELEEPIIEELPNGITLQGFENCTMNIENSITPTVSYEYNMNVAYKEEIKKQKNEIDNNNNDINDNIIPYLMDVEFNLMMMEV